jgi:hypothetical protein
MIRKIQIHSMFNDWWETDLKSIEIKEDQIINVVVENGGVYLIYYATH